jgi:hypothetical protein
MKDYAVMVRVRKQKPVQSSNQYAMEKGVSNLIQGRAEKGLRVYENIKLIEQVFSDNGKYYMSENTICTIDQVN